MHSDNDFTNVYSYASISPFTSLLTSNTTYYTNAISN